MAGVPENKGQTRPNPIGVYGDTTSLAIDNLAWSVTYFADVLAESLNNAVRAYRDVSMHNRRAQRDPRRDLG